jgi:hypothetical protein
MKHEAHNDEMCFKQIQLNYHTQHNERVLAQQREESQSNRKFDYIKHLENNKLEKEKMELQDTQYYDNMEMQNRHHNDNMEYEYERLQEDTFHRNQDRELENDKSNRQTRLGVFQGMIELEKQDREFDFKAQSQKQQQEFELEKQGIELKFQGESQKYQRQIDRERMYADTDIARITGEPP